VPTLPEPYPTNVPIADNSIDDGVDVNVDVDVNLEGDHGNDLLSLIESPSVQVPASDDALDGQQPITSAAPTLLPLIQLPVVEPASTPPTTSSGRCRRLPAGEASAPTLRRSRRLAGEPRSNPNLSGISSF
jgi:hypothetical protein